MFGVCVFFFVFCFFVGGGKGLVRRSRSQYSPILDGRKARKEEEGGHRPAERGLVTFRAGLVFQPQLPISSSNSPWEVRRQAPGGGGGGGGGKS